MLITSEAERIKAQGESAFVLGLDVDSCPYKIEDSRRSTWMAGWYDAYHRKTLAYIWNRYRMSYPIIVFLALSLIANTLFGQIELTIRPVTVIGGIESPEIFGSQLLARAESQPTKQNALLITATGEYKSLDMEAESKPNFDLSDLIKAPGRPSDWLLIGSGKYRITAYGYDPEKGQARKRIDVELGPPQPPIPPEPPTPPPVPQDLPIEGQGLRMVVIYESSDLSRMPESQKQILYSIEIREYLNSKCPQENGSFEYRFWDKDVDLEFVSERWKKAMAKPRQSIPWVAIANGKEGFAGPLPGSVADMLTLLRKYGG